MPASDQETNQNQPGSNQGQLFKEKQDVAAEICCPICFEEMVAPKKILCCTNGKQIFFIAKVLSTDWYGKTFVLEFCVF